MADFAQQIAALAPLAEGRPAVMLQLAKLLRQDGRGAEALALCRRAAALAPDDAAVQAAARWFVSEGVPAWHFTTMRDEARNAAYDSALRRAVQPGDRVLEIGAGSGLLAMMAARAGAAEVVTCEMNPAIAATAQQIVALNGVADRVRVVAKRSDQLDLEADLGGRADLLVSEIVSNNLLGEDVLPAHEHAVRDLLKPGGRVIPSAGRVRVALAHDSRGDIFALPPVSGFDLSPFAALAPPTRTFRVGDERLALRSEAANLFAFDFASPRYAPPAETALALRSAGGPVSGVVQWIALQLDEETTYENRPEPGATSCWNAVFHPFPQEIDTGAGQQIAVRGSHNRRRVTIWAEDSSLT